MHRVFSTDAERWTLHTLVGLVCRRMHDPEEEARTLCTDHGASCHRDSEVGARQSSFARK